ncbi:SCO family protein [Candidatus Puniceispirillum marinum]|uniref:Electron transport protein SCO1/SenC n=1 Tax=Puniceispirillum marinum (strain IMCC1322) TaxID=488538 RepID=D5BMS5_PUNMI|nr:SCO family protein [Candidatus Puniceispirillum marinum]ADE40118.1 electron transport protein SCO1/SenC [Candidatus Puniceispirillum marinum IMCC1322]
MSEKHQNNPPENEQHAGAGRGHSQRPFLLIVGILLFAGLAGGIFMLANRQAETSGLGFPDFEDSSFTLLDQNAQKVANADFAGRPIALFFGYSYCPDVCPMTLTVLGSALDEVKAAGMSGDDLQILFMTVDPERDTPEQLAAYLSLFDMKVTGLTGDKTSVAKALGNFGAYAQQVETSSGDILFDHSSAVYLYRANGKFKGTIVYNEPHRFVVEKIKSILE